MLPISNSEDSDGASCVRVPARGLPPPLSSAALASYWFHLRPSSSRGGAKRSTLHRLLKPRSPDDCPACRLASTPLSCLEPAPLPVRPWPEVKSRRGAPKRIDTEEFACPNHQCPYFPRFAQRGWEIRKNSLLAGKIKASQD